VERKRTCRFKLEREKMPGGQASPDQGNVAVRTAVARSPPGTHTGPLTNTLAWVQGGERKHRKVQALSSKKKIVQGIGKRGQYPQY